MKRRASEQGSPARGGAMQGGRKEMEVALGFAGQGRWEMEAGGLRRALGLRRVRITTAYGLRTAREVGDRGWWTAAYCSLGLLLARPADCYGLLLDALGEEGALAWRARRRRWEGGAVASGERGRIGRSCSWETETKIWKCSMRP